MTVPPALTAMALGVFRFGINAASYQTLSREAEYRWETVDRIGRAPSEQYAGVGSQTITLEGTIYPHFKGGLRQVELMRAAAGQGVPMMLVDGLGWVFHQWVITRVSGKDSVFLPDGSPKKIEFSLDLRSYGSDRGWQFT